MWRSYLKNNPIFTVLLHVDPLSLKMLVVPSVSRKLVFFAIFGAFSAENLEILFLSWTKISEIGLSLLSVDPLILYSYIYICIYQKFRQRGGRGKDQWG